jgi:Fe-S cluster biogenesis protein NfuA
MFIQTEQTPNPNVLKFLPGQAVLAGNPVEIENAEKAKAMSPFAVRLFDISGVSNVFLASDYISVSKADDVEWIRIKPLILAVIMDHIGGGLPIIDEAGLNSAANAGADVELDEISQQIVELIDMRIRPAVAQDGGDIEFSSFENGIVYVQMRGACAGCPSATMTLKSGIENMLKHYVPEVLEVRELPM